MNPVAESRRILVLLWTLVLGALLFGAVVTAYLGWTTWELRSQRALQTHHQAVLERVSLELRNLLVEGREELSGILDGSRSGDTTPRHHSADRFEQVIQLVRSDGRASAAGTRALEQVSTDLHGIWAQALAWRSHFDALTADGQREHTLAHVRNLLDRMRTALEAIQEERRRRETATLHRYQQARDGDADALAHAIVQGYAARFGSLSGSLEVELVEIARLVEVLVGTGDPERLAELRDNGLKPGLERLRLGLQQLGADRKTPPSLAADVLESLMTGLFGIGYDLDGEQQSLRTGSGGLYNLQYHRLALMTERKHIEARITGVMERIARLQAEQAAFAQQQSASLSRRVEGRLADTLYRVLSAFALGALLFLVLAWAISRSVRRQVSDQIRLHREHELILSAVGDGIMGLDTEGRTTFVNPAAINLLGWPPEQLLGQPQHALIHHSHADGTPYPERECTIHSTLRDGLGHHRQDEVFWRQDGSSLQVEYRSNPMRDQAGRVQGAVVTFHDITERRRREEDVTRFMTTLDQIQDCVFLFEPGSLRFFYVNHGATRQVGYSRREMLGMTPIDIKPEFTEQRFRELLQPLLDGSRASVSLQTVHRHKNGTLIPVDITLQYVSEEDAGGRFVAVVRDVTQQKKTAAALEKALALSNTILEAIPVGIVIIGRDKLVRRANQAALRMMQRHPEEVIGRICHDTLCPAQVGNCPVWDLGGAVDTSEKVLLCGDGRELPVLKTAVPLTLDGDEVLLEAFVDISDRKRAEEEMRQANQQLRHSEQRFQDVVLSSADWIWEVDREGRYTFASGRVADILGYQPEELLGKTPFDLMEPEEAGRVAPLFGRLVADRAPIQDLENWNLTKDGQRVCMQTNGVPMLDDGGALSGYRGVDKDITERKRAEEEMQEARRLAEGASLAKSEFLATMSHEIRTPMNGILGMAELLAGSRLDDEQRDQLDTIQHSGRALLTILNDILDFSKIEAGRLELEPIAFDLENAVHDVVQLLVPRAEEKGLELLLHFAPQCPRHVTADPGRLRQVLLNLVGNALKFTEQGHVLVEISRPGADADRAELLFRVEDTGIGIPPEAQERLFRSFSQADASTTRRFGGTGLGLAISKRLVELMDGEIGVHSEPGRGATFWFRLTLPVAAPPEPLPMADLRGVRALVVDDNPINRDILCEQLGGFGMTAAAAADPEQALHLLHGAIDGGQPFGILLSDYLMPCTNGLDLTRSIRSDRTLGRLPVMILSSAGQKGDARRLKQAGVDAYLTKPVRSGTLRSTLAGVLGLGQDATDAPLVTRYRVAESLPPEQLTGRVLLAEDNQVNRKVALSMLRQLGLETRVATNGREALAQWEGDGFDLILMDCQMPVMDGYAATRAIRDRERRNGGHVPVIALTANALASDRHRCLEAGMDEYLAKPFTQDALSAVLEQWLSAAPPPDDGPVTEPQASRPAPHPTSDDGDAILDTGKLDALRTAMGEDFVELIPAYLGDAEAILENLPKALAAGDAPEVQRLAHSLKSTSANVGADGLSARAKALEALGKEGDLSDAAQRIEALAETFALVRGALEAFAPQA